MILFSSTTDRCLTLEVESAVKQNEGCAT